MSHDPSDFKFSLAVGVAGAYVEVTDDVRWDNAITRTWGTQNQFTAPAPGVWQFTLDNTTGKYSPDNPASTLATLLGEGTGACWSLNGALRSGQVRALQPVFTDIGVPASSARMRVTVTDMLGIAALNTLGDLGDSIGRAQPGYYPFSDQVGSASVAEAHGLPSLNPTLNGGTVTFGIPAAGFVVGTQCEIAVAAAAVQTLQSAPIFLASVQLSSPVSNATALGLVVTAKTTTTYLAVASDALWGRQLGIQNGLFYYFSVASSAWVATTTPCVPGVQYFVQGVRVGNVWTMYVNSVAAATDTAAFFFGTLGNTTVTVGNAAAGAGDIVIAEMMIGTAVLNVADAGVTTEAGRLAVIDQTTSLITLATLPTDLSTAPVGIAATSGQSAMDALNAVILTEQGYIDTITTGSLLAPIQSIRVRARQRPVTPAATFAIGTDLTGAPEFARSLNDEIYSEKATGSDGTSQTYSNAALVQRVGSANGSDTLVTYKPSDLLEWASDRVWRGIKRFTDVTSITLDARGGSGSSLWNTLTAIAGGDRLHLTGFPVAQLGYSTWDGFVIGCEETHISQAQSIFKLFLAPCPPTTIVIDTDYIGNGTNSVISTLLTSGATSLLVTPADGISAFSTTTLNYYLLIESEVVKVTAASAIVAGAQTLTITRAQNSTVAVAHAVGVAPEVADDPTDTPVSVLITF